MYSSLCFKATKALNTKLGDLVGNWTANTSLNMFPCLCAVRGVGENEYVNVSK